MVLVIFRYKLNHSTVLCDKAMKNREFLSEKENCFFWRDKMKKRSIVKKQMLLYLGTIAVCVFTLCGVLSMAYTRQYMNEKKDELIEQGQKIALGYTKAYLTGSIDNLSYEVQILENYMGANILMVNEDGVVMLASPALSDGAIGQTLSYEGLVEGLLDGNVVSLVTKSGGFFDMPMLIVGYPIQAGQMAGIFMCCPMPEIEASLRETYGMGLVSIFFVSLFAVFVSYMTSKKMTKPIMEMNEAAKIIARGDFEKRVEITGSDELGQLAESFNLMAESLQRNEKLQRDFIANVSHDLRSPLTSMQGFLTALLDGTIPPERQEKYLRIVLEETERLSRMTKGIVELSRAESSSILLDETDFELNDVIRSNTAVLEPQLQKRGVSIRAIYAEQKTMVHGDRDKISRVVQNLLSNAVKFSPEGGVIEVETTLTEKKKVLVSVKDEGIGISAEDQKYIFDRFYKGDPTRNLDAAGSGIGLCIAREFIQAHGETITVKSEEGKGSTFAFSLKLA